MILFWVEGHRLSLCTAGTAMGQGTGDSRAQGTGDVAGDRRCDRAQGTGDVTILSSQAVGISSEQSYEAVSELELEREGCR